MTLPVIKYIALIGGWNIYLKKNPLQDLLSSLNAVISAKRGIEL